MRKGDTSLQKTLQNSAGWPSVPGDLPDSIDLTASRHYISVKETLAFFLIHFVEFVVFIAKKGFFQKFWYFGTFGCVKIKIKRVTLSQNIWVICKICFILCLDLHETVFFCSSDFLGSEYIFFPTFIIPSRFGSNYGSFCFVLNDALLFPFLHPQLFSKSFFVVVYAVLQLPFESGYNSQYRFPCSSFSLISPLSIWLKYL